MLPSYIRKDKETPSFPLFTSWLDLEIFQVSCFVYALVIMDKIRSSAILCKLLCCNVDHMKTDDLRKLVKRRFRQWHPDKNHDNPHQFVNEFRELKKAWDVFNGQDSYEEEEEVDSGRPSTSGMTADDLYCDEEMEFSSDSDSEYNNTPFDDEFFIPSPKKEFAIPEGVKEFFRSKSNRRASKLFMIFTPLSNEKGVIRLFEINNVYLGVIKVFLAYKIRTNKDIYCVVVSFNTDRRISDVKLSCRKCAMLPFEVFYAVKLSKMLTYLKTEYGEPVIVKVSPDPEPEKRPEGSKFNHRLLIDFALSHQISDPLELMYEYAHLGTSCDRKSEEITREHEEDHD